jgi:hypothetical protein
MSSPSKGKENSQPETTYHGILLSSDHQRVHSAEGLAALDLVAAPVIQDLW